MEHSLQNSRIVLFVGPREYDRIIAGYLVRTARDPDGDLSCDVVVLIGRGIQSSVAELGSELKVPVRLISNRCSDLTSIYPNIMDTKAGDLAVFIGWEEPVTGLNPDHSISISLVHRTDSLTADVHVHVVSADSPPRPGSLIYERHAVLEGQNFREILEDLAVAVNYIATKHIHWDGKNLDALRVPDYVG